MNKNLITIFILIFVIITIISCLILKKKEKFEDVKPIFSPTILRVSKKKADAIVEWYNDDKRIKEFIVLYTSVIPENSGVWVQRKIKCDKKKCRLMLRDLIGKRYKLTVLSVLKEDISDIDNIVDFSDEKEFNNLFVIESPALSTSGTDNVKLLPNKKSDSKINKKISFPSPSPTESNNKSQSSNNKNDKEKKKPIIHCEPKVTRKNIKTKEELESAEIDYVCEDDREIGQLETYIEKKPFYHNTWEKIFE